MLTVTGAAVAGTALLTGDGPTPPPVVATPAPDPEQLTFSALGCGSQLRTHDPAPDGPLDLEIDLEPVVDPGDEGPIGTATVTNTGDEHITGSTSPGPDSWVTRDGTVVTEPGPQRAVAQPLSLAPGESATYDVHSFVRQCVPSDVTQPWHEPLQPGRYDVYVELRVSNAASTSDRAIGELMLYGGPVEIQIE
ncbi:hypothetical protein [Jiangella gansuensis]|uniref:hypothetical protein n=1 Tax=Jiangella gansuensis TaxID=281473 RepID=UPI0012F81FAA|nr:hypothetical protein [Jiangella gansuensis]